MLFSVEFYELEVYIIKLVHYFRVWYADTELYYRKIMSVRWCMYTFYIVIYTTYIMRCIYSCTHTYHTWL